MTARGTFGTAGRRAPPRGGAAADDARPSAPPAPEAPPLPASLDDRRVHAARKLCDVILLPSTRASANERHFAADLLMHVIGSLPADVRAEIAGRIARLSEPPLSLVQALLTDVADVAAPVLRAHNSIPSELLLECARTGGPAHWLLLAARQGLSPTVADWLARHADEAALIVLLNREAAAFSPTAVDALAARALREPGLREPLLRRAELEPGHGFLLFWIGDTAFRRRAIARFALDPSTVQDALRPLYPGARLDGANDAALAALLDIADRRRRPRGPAAGPVAMEIVFRTLSAARRAPSAELADAVAFAAGVSDGLARRIVFDPGAEPFAILAKSLGVSRADFAVLAAEAPQDAEPDPERVENGFAVFDAITRNYARAVVRYWDWQGAARMASVLKFAQAQAGRAAAGAPGGGPATSRQLQRSV